MMGFGFGMGLWGLMGMIIFWIFLAALAVWLVRLLFPPATQPDDHYGQTRSAEEILKLRYARGELSEQQYQQMLETIQK